MMCLKKLQLRNLVALIGDEIKTNEGTLEGDGGKQTPGQLGR